MDQDQVQALNGLAHEKWSALLENPFISAENEIDASTSNRMWVAEFKYLKIRKKKTKKIRRL